MLQNYKSGNNSDGKLTTHQSVDQIVRSIYDIVRWDICAEARQNVPTLTRLLFSRILDAREQHETQNPEAVGVACSPLGGTLSLARLGCTIGRGNNH
ncbi:MAG TPA: hypothetical protein PKI05_05835 [Thermogutta sp.]|nr:hypothetical protein [Thermogutta sp.]HOP78694.1 hypothetical protein [Thermogutta sp.]HPZ83191.1 hypothetical protein [Thermogutta sp.]